MITRDKNTHDVLGSALQGQSFQTFVDTLFADKYNAPQFTSMFTWGTPQIDFTYEQIEGAANVYAMATVTDYSSPAPLRGTQGARLSTGTIPRMKHGFVINEKEIRTEMLLIQRGAKLNIPAMQKILFNSTDQLLGGNHNRLTHMALQAESTGGYVLDKDSNPDGIPLLFDFNVPGKNYLKAGFYSGAKKGFGTKYPWSDDRANPIGDLRDMVKFAKDNHISYGVIRMSTTKWDELVAHKSTRLAVLQSKGYDINTIGDNFMLLDGWVEAYLKGFRTLPPVEVVDSLSFTESYDKEAGKLVYTPLSGFKDDNVVLRPAGIIGEIKCATPLTVPDPAARFAYFDGGRTLLKQTFDADMNNQKIQSELTALPVLTRPSHFVILDTTKAAS